MPIFNMEDEIKDVDNFIKQNEMDPVYNADIPLSNVIKNIGGYKWYVDYYNAISTHEDFTSDFDPGLDTPITEYVKIEGLPLIVDAPLDTSEPNNLNGSGYVDVDMKPTNGDVIVAKLMDGRLGLFDITSVSKHNYNLKDIFKIEYKLKTIVNNKQDDLYVKLEAAKAKELIYNRDSKLGSDRTLFTRRELNDHNSVVDYIGNLINLFNDKIIIPDVKYTISFIENNRIVHDPYLEDFVVKTFGVSSLIDRVTLYGARSLSNLTIFDILTDNTPPELISVLYSLEPSSKFGTSPILKSMVFSGISQVVTPNRGTIIHTDSNSSNVLLPVVNNNNYLFSSNFYEVLTNKTVFDNVDLSLIEKCLIASIKKEPIPLDNLKNIIYSLYTNNDIKILYYYIPITIYLLRYYLTTIVRSYI